MLTVTKEQLDDLVQRLVAGLGPERIYLYGSHAGGTPHIDSDIDILIVVPDVDGKKSDIYTQAEQCLRGSGLPAELVIFTCSEFDRQRDWVSSLPYTIAKKGKLLYAA